MSESSDENEWSDGAGDSVFASNGSSSKSRGSGVGSKATAAAGSSRMASTKNLAAKGRAAEAPNKKHKGKNHKGERKHKGEGKRKRTDKDNGHIIDEYETRSSSDGASHQDFGNDIDDPSSNDSEVYDQSDSGSDGHRVSTMQASVKSKKKVKATKEEKPDAYDLDKLIISDSPMTFSMSALKIGEQSEVQIYGPPGRFSEGTIGMIVARSLLTKRVVKPTFVDIQDTILQYAVQRGNI